MKPREVKSLLEKNGFTQLLGRGKGSHMYFVNGEKSTTVPNHNKDITKKTLSKILKQAGLK